MFAYGFTVESEKEELGKVDIIFHFCLDRKGFASGTRLLSKVKGNK